MAKALRRFWKERRRDLPWRETRDPYAIWVSEVMLQQTTVATARTRYPRFLSRFPTVESLARASEADVLAAWSGLGYYSRARNLRQAAIAVVERGGFPRRAAELDALPGVGAYTAAAVASIAFGERVAVVDGNVARVLSRLFALRLDAKTPRGMSRLRELAASLLPRRGAGDHNQTLMDLGATVCTPRSPRCEDCPLAALCVAHRSGRTTRFPPPRKAKSPTRHRLAAGVAFRNGKLVLVPDVHLVKGHIGPVLVELADGDDPSRALAVAWRRAVGRESAALVPLGALKHSVLDRRYDIHVFTVIEGRTPSRRARKPHLVAPSDLERIPHGGLLRKIVAKGWTASTRSGKLSRRNRV